MTKQNMDGVNDLEMHGTDLMTSHLHAERVCAVDDPDQGICLLKIVTPVGAQRLLAAHIPDV